MSKMSDPILDLFAASAAVPASQARDSDHQPPASTAPTCTVGYTITAERGYGKGTEDRLAWSASADKAQQAARRFAAEGWANVRVWNADGSPATAAPAASAPAASAPALLLLTDQRPAATRKRSLLAALRNRNAPRSVAPPQQEEVVAEVRASIAVARRDRKPTATAPAAPPAPVERPFFTLHPPVRAATAAPPAPPPPAAPFPGSQRNRPAAVADLFAPQPTGGNPYAVALLSGSDLFHGTPASPQAAKATRCKRWFLLNDADKYLSRNGEFLHHRSFAFAYRNRDAAAFVASRLPASLGRVRVETR